MKIRCECGEIISDNTDSIPHKSYVIPDQRWDSLFDEMDQMLADVVDGQRAVESAPMDIRMLFSKASENMYQCGRCGRLIAMNSQRCRSYIPEESKQHFKALVLAVADDFECEQESVRVEAIRVHNEAARLIARNIKSKGLRCPHCYHHSYETEFVDRGSTEWAFFQCPSCSRTFRLEKFKA